jgi:hypothetical protein
MLIGVQASSLVLSVSVCYVSPTNPCPLPPASRLCIVQHTHYRQKKRGKKTRGFPEFYQIFNKKVHMFLVTDFTGNGLKFHVALLKSHFFPQT